MTAVAQKRKKIVFPSRHFVLAVGITLAILIVAGLIRRGAVYYRVSQEQALLEAKYEAVREYNDWLLDQYDTVQSPAYIEMIARNELKWSRPDETVVVIIPNTRAQNQFPIAPVSNTPATPNEETPLQQWRELLLPSSAP